MRLIDAEDLLKQEWFVGYHPYKEDGTIADADKVAKEVLEQCKRIVANTPTAPAWISVKDRLPERHGLYIVMTDRAHAIYSCLYMEDRGFVAEAHVQPGYGKLQMDTVTHWMEIPEVPE